MFNIFITFLKTNFRNIPYRHMYSYTKRLYCQNKLIINAILFKINIK